MSFTTSSHSSGNAMFMGFTNDYPIMIGRSYPCVFSLSSNSNSYVSLISTTGSLTTNSDANKKHNITLKTNY